MNNETINNNNVDAEKALQDIQPLLELMAQGQAYVLEKLSELSTASLASLKERVKSALNGTDRKSLALRFSAISLALVLAACVKVPDAQGASNQDPANLKPGEPELNLGGENTSIDSSAVIPTPTAKPTDILKATTVPKATATATAIPAATTAPEKATATAIPVATENKIDVNTAVFFKINVDGVNIRLAPKNGTVIDQAQIGSVFKGSTDKDALKVAGWVAIETTDSNGKTITAYVSGDFADQLTPIEVAEIIGGQQGTGGGGVEIDSTNANVASISQINNLGFSFTITSITDNPDGSQAVWHDTKEIGKIVKDPTDNIVKLYIDDKLAAGVDASGVFMRLSPVDIKVSGLATNLESATPTPQAIETISTPEIVQDIPIEIILDAGNDLGGILKLNENANSLFLDLFADSLSRSGVLSPIMGTTKAEVKTWLKEHDYTLPREFAIPEHIPGAFHDRTQFEEPAQPVKLDSVHFRLLWNGQKVEIAKLGDSVLWSGNEPGFGGTAVMINEDGKLTFIAVIKNKQMYIDRKKLGTAAMRSTYQGFLMLARYGNNKTGNEQAFISAFNDAQHHDNEFAREGGNLFTANP